jgi:hypothetical protein
MSHEVLVGYFIVKSRTHPHADIKELGDHYREYH